LLKETTLRLRYFIWRAGVVIIPVCVILGTLNALTIDGLISTEDASKASVLSWIAQAITPIFSPMGLHLDNWPATVGLLTGMLSKEVVVGSLNTLYAQMGHVGQSPEAGFHLLNTVQTALWTIPHNLAGLASAFWNPVAASAPIDTLSAPVYGVMYDHFDGQIGAYAYLLFILLYIPCASTMAVIRQEASRQLMWFSVAWSLMVAYSVAVLFYQLATIQAHPEQTVAWVLGISLSVFGFILCIRVVAQGKGGRYAVTNS
jgi:ferrous iron transport protein B